MKVAINAYALRQVPKRKPQALIKPGEKPRQAGQPKKFVPFSAGDSRSIEQVFQRLAEEEENKSKKGNVTGDITDATLDAKQGVPEFGVLSNTSLDNCAGRPQKLPVKVPVNEDFLFDVDIDNRELAPAYWLGPIYDVRRATWFFNDGSTCDENLATQLEEGYLKSKPWRYEPPPLPTRSSSQSKRPASWRPGDAVGKLGATSIKPPRVSSVDDAKNRNKEEADPSSGAPTPPKFQLQTHRLFGAHMNSVVTYQDATVAWLVTDDFLSRMSTTVYQRFAGGGHLGGIKVTRGFMDSSAKKETRTEGATEITESDERGRSGISSTRRATSQSRERPASINIEKTKVAEQSTENKRTELERRMATIVGSPSFEDPSAQEEEVRRREEDEIQEDYKDTDAEEQGREIEHLILVTHGIGQRLGLKMESLSFIHDVNVFRKTLKSVYKSSPDLQALNSEVEKLPKNCRVQVLPIVWRHLLDFPKQSFKRLGKEQDLSDANVLGEDLDYPKLSDITVDGVPAIRNLVEDLFLDILLYQSSYRYYIAGIIQRECNRVHKLFVQRNPSFKGKVSLVGHSLGSAIMFDLLCRQKGKGRGVSAVLGNRTSRKASGAKQKGEENDLALDFEVEDFYALGSPIGLFQMIEGRTIAGRRANVDSDAESSTDPHSANDTYRRVSSSTVPGDSALLSTISSPKCAQVFNIFHPTDPVAYRLEPLISPVMKALKPQPLPYIKKGLFGAPVAGLSGIGVRVGQSVSGLWSNIATGVASSLLNRSLGLTHDPQQVTNQTRQPLSLGVGAGVPASETQNVLASEVSAEGGTQARSEAGDGDIIEHPPTLIDTEIETLYSGFQRQQYSGKRDKSRDRAENPDSQEVEDRARQYRKEEAKVRALNSTGRVDFNIQE